MTDIAARSTYSKYVRFVIVFMAEVIAMAPSAPTLFPRRLQA